MRTVKQEYQVYDFDELGEEAKKKAIDEHRDFLASVIDLDFEVSEMTRLLEMFGFNNTKVHYSGFWSQGDGASFTASYKHIAGGLKAVKTEFAGTWFKEVIEYLELLEAINKKCFYSLLYRIDSNSRYCHANTMNINYIDDYRGNRDFSKYEDDILEYTRAIGNELYYLLDKSYSHQLMSDAVIDSIEANEYEFYENGKMA